MDFRANKTKIIGSLFIALILLILGAFIWGKPFLKSFSGRTASLLNETFGNKDLVQELPLRSNEAVQLQEKEDSSRDSEEILFNEVGVSGQDEEALAPFRSCVFETTSSPTHQSLVINEVAWMGTKESINDEWIELKNISGENLDISGWQILDKESQIKITLPVGASIFSGKFYLLERKESSVPEQKAGVLYVGSLKNSDEGLRLFNPSCNLVDEVFASPNWPAGENDTKRTMERSKNLAWHTSAFFSGTPSFENSEPPLPKEEIIEPEVSGNYSQPEEPPPANSPLQTEPQSETTPAKNILISEIQVGTETPQIGAEDEFVELYNPNDEPVNLSGWSLKKKTISGSEYNLVSASAFVGTISAKGFFLVAHQNYKGGEPADLTYSANSNNLAYTNNSVVLYRSNNILVEEVGWAEIPKGESWERTSWDGNQFEIQPVPNPENSVN